jgi:hypothetical protein
MSDPQTAEIIVLQQRLISRLDEIGGVGRETRNNLARELAHVSVLARTFSEKILPLFLSIDLRHERVLKELIVSMKQHMDEVRDAIKDLEPGCSELIESFGQDGT